MSSRSVSTVMAGLIGAAFAIATLTGCTASDPSSTSSSTEVLAQFGFEKMNANEIIDQLEATPVAERSEEFVASVRPDILTISNTEGQEVSLEMPADQFYLSVAPYINQTHECFLHSLTTCLGELRGENVSVSVVDANNTVLIDQNLRTADNGFVGLWLPRDIDATLTITQDGRVATVPISTRNDDPTCLTTPKLT